MQNKAYEWFPLDNAGSVFPGQNSEKWSNVFRISVKMKRDIDPEILQQALEGTLDRMPSLRVRIRKGFFGYYFEHNTLKCPVHQDIKNFCYRIGFRENNGYLLRIYYRNRSISADIYHALCDGHTGTVFISTLAGEYLRLCGEEIAYNSVVLDVREGVSKEETEDAYLRYAADDTKANLVEKRAYHLKGKKLPDYLCNYTTAYMSFSRLHSLCKSLGVTVTEYLAAELLDIHYRKQLAQGKSKNTVSVQIPVNLRNFFPSESLRNFVLCVTVSINPRDREFTFEDILESVREQLRRINNKKAHNAYITRTVKLGNRQIRFVPLVIKDFVVRTVFFFGAEYSTSALLSNLGAVRLPEVMEKHIEGFQFYTGPGLVNGARCAAVSFGDCIAFTFSNCYEQADVEREFLKRLSDKGIKITVETNRGSVFDHIGAVEKGDRDAYSEEIFIPSKKDRIRLVKSDISFSESCRRFFRF